MSCSLSEKAGKRRARASLLALEVNLIVPQAPTPCSRVLAGGAVGKAEDGGCRMTGVVAMPSLAGGAAAWTEKREAERSLTGPQRCTPDRERCSNVRAASQSPGARAAGSEGPVGTHVLLHEPDAIRDRRRPAGGGCPSSAAEVRRHSESVCCPAPAPMCAGPPQLDPEHLSLPDLRTHSRLLHLENIQIFSKFCLRFLNPLCSFSISANTNHLNSKEKRYEKK